jgi:selenide,water dikinase
LDAADDAAVWKIDEERALVMTTDFFTPIVDDPYDYGAIAATNSLSDVYAMGGKPVLALNIAALPGNLPIEMTREIIRGAAEKAKEAGAVIAGGHSVVDKEPKFGLVVIGMVEIAKILTKGGAKPGDKLFLSKPLGMGVTTTAFKGGLATEEDMAEVTFWMKQLNKQAGQLAVDCELKAVTDVTGFGLIGHSSEIALASAVGLDFDFSKLPFIEACHKHAEAFLFPGGASNNKLFYGDRVWFDPKLTDIDQMLLFDPQTSGGLLMSVPAEVADRFHSLALERDIPVWEIGSVSEQSGIRVHKSL